MTMIFLRVDRIVRDLLVIFRRSRTWKPASSRLLEANGVPSVVTSDVPHNIFRSPSTVSAVRLSVGEGRDQARRIIDGHRTELISVR